MTNSFKVRVNDFVKANVGLKRKDYIAAFVDMGMSAQSASIYHYKYVTSVVRDQKKIAVAAPVVAKGPVRDPKTGRFLKKAA